MRPPLIALILLVIGLNCSVVRSASVDDPWAADLNGDESNQLVRENENLQERSYGVEDVENVEDYILSNNQRAIGDRYARDCYDIKGTRQRMRSGVYEVAVEVGSMQIHAQVYCDMLTDGGGWLLIQRRFNGKTNFYRTWQEYAEGFGSASKEYWLGNDMIHALTSGDTTYTLRIDMEMANGNRTYAEYDTFSIDSQDDKYRLRLGAYSGTAGDALTYHNNVKFSTRDRDNDNHASASCALAHKSGWWFNACVHSDLNGMYVRGVHSGGSIYWYTLLSYRNSQLVKTEMKIRPNL